MRIVELDYSLWSNAFHGVVIHTICGGNEFSEWRFGVL